MGNVVVELVVDIVLVISISGGLGGGDASGYEQLLG